MKNEITIADNVPLPNARAICGRTRYPYEALIDVGYSFHIPATEENPEPYKKLGPPVWSANQRFSKKGLPNRFVVRKVDSDDPLGPGARVFRER